VRDDQSEHDLLGAGQGGADAGGRDQHFEARRAARCCRGESHGRRLWEAHSRRAQHNDVRRKGWLCFAVLRYVSLHLRRLIMMSHAFFIIHSFRQ